MKALKKENKRNNRTIFSHNEKKMFEKYENINEGEIYPSSKT